MNAARQSLSDIAPMHPNELDRRRIERALEARKRYRYVTPSVDPIGGGYVIRSACCSRNVDPQGGIVDVALLLWVPGAQPWQLYRKHHEARQWLLHSLHQRLAQLLEQLNTDPQRQFWQ
jgi:hypothetical protein